MASCAGTRFGNTTKMSLRIIFQILFYLHLLLTAATVIFITVYGLTSESGGQHFHPLKWYPPVLASTACGGVISFLWQWITFSYPRNALKAAFWLGPLLTCLMAGMFVYIGTATSLIVGLVSFCSALAQSLYGCWVRPRFEYATNILSVSTAFPPAKTGVSVLATIVIGTLYCCFLVSGIGGATALQDKFKLAFIFILVIMLSLGWTMQFLKNVIQLTISRVTYLQILGNPMDTCAALRDSINRSVGCIAIGSILIPVFTLLRSFGRSMSLLGGENEIMFCCVSYCMGMVNVLPKFGSRWSFVHIGVYNKEFVDASQDTWEIFTGARMLPLIDSDLTGALCFLSGVAVGAFCSMVSGIWILVMHQSYALEVSIYAFLIGYFMCRLAMGWLQACVAAYYVAYGENPVNDQFDSTIPARLEQIQRSQAL
ncbi:protein PNS1 isoform X1 [Arachis hypogaea]|uniref:Choline transporter-like protein n=2 Tax=Arachis hypogaea TaxID=3818 RepID=A0A445CS48_ARAHY|nr:protein PNS1 isoform X1 [Arachis hypogaea]RYR53786.1 hypothetical protein Ahy_A06g029033 [Arachis hypogaea]